MVRSDLARKRKPSVCINGLASTNPPRTVCVRPCRGRFHTRTFHPSIVWRRRGVDPGRSTTAAIFAFSPTLDDTSSWGSFEAFQTKQAEATWVSPGLHGQGTGEITHESSFVRCCTKKCPCSRKYAASQAVRGKVASAETNNTQQKCWSMHQTENHTFQLTRSKRAQALLLLSSSLTQMAPQSTRSKNHFQHEAPSSSFFHSRLKNKIKVRPLPGNKTGRSAAGLLSAGK